MPGGQKLSAGSSISFVREHTSLSDPSSFLMRLVRLAVVSTLLALLGCVVGSTPAQAQMEIPPRSFEDVISQASAQQTPILVEIYTTWCPYCQRMQETVYADSSVQNYLSDHFTYVRLNSDTTTGTHRYRDRTLSTKQLASVLGAEGVPTTVFLTSDGTPIARQPGFIERSTFLTMLRFVGSEAYQDQSYREFAGAPSR